MAYILKAFCPVGIESTFFGVLCVCVCVFKFLVIDHAKKKKNLLCTIVHNFHPFSH